MIEAHSYSRVLLRALCLNAHIGYYAHEKGVRQPLVVDVELTLKTTRFGDDDIHGTVDYDKVAKIARDLADTHVDLVETFCENLADRCLALPLVIAVRLHIDKPQAVPGAIAGVEIFRVK